MSEDLREGGYSDRATFLSNNAKIYEESLVKFKEKFQNGDFKIKEELNYSSEEEDIDVGINDNISESEDEAAMDLTSDDKALENLQKKGVRSFGIDDILSHKGSESIVRPWDRVKEGPRLAKEDADQGRSPLDALFSMATSFEALKQQSELERSQQFGRKEDLKNKKKRKSRTAFTNAQIFELEKRFLYQKYLSPADRDEIALGLGLSNGQVITWFQNRRAKFKRDVEEMKKDVEKGAPAPISHHHPENMMSRLPPPPPPFPTSLPTSLPHPLPLFCLAPHLMYPFHRASSPSSPSPPMRSPIAVSPPIRVDDSN